MFSPTFTFDAPTRSSSLTSTTTRSSSRSVSPCSSRPDQIYTVTDLAASFQNSKLLRRDAQICYDSCDAYANTADDDAAWAIPSMEEDEDEDVVNVPVLSWAKSRSRTGTATTERANSPTSRRNQRQVSTRRLCSSATHRRDIEALVKRMVEREEQCAISSAACSSANEVEETTGVNGMAESDEGYDSEVSLRRVVTSATDDGGMRRVISVSTEVRRASEMRVNGACVSKAVRFRREGRVKR
ncbi:unnamed protein product [Zymoseptoria tritici ST99CH_1A5]|uniref:Uncharacterized protein n=2 Tax=Zymoseptoria tritici TaxID=1047171 RepID=A0A2H1GBH6_ZYMTR|nr:unnamed protein product [Zymoseptoria tritici ST99CH_1E4]SMR51837.1 unnamed protein product [Zymoseptoria tritici ST99CH_3D1]SMY23595.1 unnamed protein product [Zymoseptoria tritici ST99CH_1A5]